MHQRILVTGGTGFAGSHLIEQLLKSNQPEHIFVTSFSNNSSVVDTLLPAENIHRLDLSDGNATIDVFQKIKPDEIYRLAACSAVGDSFAAAEHVLSLNTHIQLSVLEAVKISVPDSRLVLVGSAQVYDAIVATKNHRTSLDENAPLGPANPYGVSKLTQDFLSLSYYYSYNLNCLRVRPFNHIGERQTDSFVVASFAKQIVAIERGEQKELNVGNLTAVRDFSDVKDMVVAYELVMKKGEVGEVYNVGTGIGTKIQRILDQLIAMAQTEVVVNLDQDRLRPLDVPVLIADNVKITNLGWLPLTPLTDTLTRILNYWRNQ